MTRSGRGVRRALSQLWECTAILGYKLQLLTVTVTEAREGLIIHTAKGFLGLLWGLQILPS